ncbi:NTP transferase domain-containing protein [Qipengyuania soli]|uniref:NTP transferase domain-containing protein n=1 Tax=Qipengyuania soli TaxID=2782568 RepID=A0A7S8F232_9SPHN|nr:NTP transferase domain-containing protein [Qipengyuania soli]QPC97731.1 NTP transferase domain-containing protein [Qipengyuania soli]
MDALILAAGFGSRLREVEPCKPLTRLHSLSLLEIAVRQLASVGVTRVVVATGYLADEIEAALPSIAELAGILVEARRVQDYNLPNGHSVLAGAAGFSGEFLLVMADHLFSRQVLQALVDRGVPDHGVVLAIDRRVDSPLVDPDDATWVETGDDGRIRKIGKSITRYDAVDCGAFLATPALLAAIASAIAGGKAGSLSEGMQRLADDGRAWTTDIDGAWWIDVDDARDLELARQQVTEQCPELFASDEFQGSVPA